MRTGQVVRRERRDCCGTLTRGRRLLLSVTTTGESGIPRLARAVRWVAVLTLGFHVPALAGDRPDINIAFTAAQRADLYTQMLAYIDANIILEHCNPPCDKHGTARFLVWHRTYIKKMEDFLISQGRPEFVPLPEWDPNSCIPDEFILVGGGVDPNCPASAACPCAPGSNCNLLPLTPNPPRRCPGISLPTSLSIPQNLCGLTNFNSFRSTLESYHNPVHGAVGGTMGGFKSPAAPIFWLWHAFVDDVWYEWQCDCGLGEGNAFNSYPAEEKIVDLQAGRADLWIRDSDADIANEPNNETGAVLWESKDIWVRNIQATDVGGTRYNRYTFEHQHQNPEYAAILTNRPYIYVKFRNRGCQRITGQLHVYWANASTSLLWPSGFTEVPTSPVTIQFPSIEGGRDEVAEFHWTDIPDPNAGGGDHFCLVARFVATPTTDDPIVNEQLNVNIDVNVKNSNQIAWKNVTIVDDVQNIAGVLVPGSDQPVKLCFEVPEDQASDSYFNYGALEVDLGFKLFQIWLKGGAQGKGITVEGMDRILIEGPNACIANLLIDPSDQYLINLTFDQVTAPCENDRTVFDVILTEYGEPPPPAEPLLLGGNTYLVSMNPISESPPVIVITNDPLSDCSMGSVSLSSSATPPPGHTITARQWFVDGGTIPGANQPDYTATMTGEYSVRVTYSNGCDNTSLPVPVNISTAPPNDDVCNATALTLGVAELYNNFCAGSQPGEVSPGAGSGALDGCNSQDGWCAFETGIQNSVWFTFLAPPSGSVSIEVGEHEHANVQLAVWEAPSCSNFSGFALIAANDDFHGGVFGTNPAIHDLSGLTPGNFYYVQLDGFDGWEAMGTIMFDCCAPPPCTPAPPDMVAWWPLDEPAGATTVNDIAPQPSSTANNQGTPLPGGQVGSPGPTSVPAVVGTGLLFPSASWPTYVNVVNQADINFGTGDFTIDAWIKPENQGTVQPIVDKLDNLMNGGYALFVQNGDLVLRLGDGGGLVGAVSTGISVTYGAWNLVAVTVVRGMIPDSPTVTFYIDGAFAGSGPTSGQLINALSTPTDLWIGNSRLISGPISFGEIAVDELEIFKRDLTQQEIQAIFSAGSAGKCLPCPQPVVQIVYDGGRDESCNFTAPNDPATRSGCLNTAYPTPGLGWKDFDDMSSNHFFGHTFDNLPKGIIAATLEICMKPHSDIPGNDSINLCLNGCSPPAWAWGSLIANLPGNGGTWNNGEPCQCFTLDLAALPNVGGTGTNILSCLNSRCRLDLLVQDDTAVDHAQLTMTVCPCNSIARTYRAGLRDCFAPPPPAEPTSRCQGVTDLRTLVPFLWKDFDVATIDRGVGQTFTNLPSGIVRAELEIGMDLAPGGGNDSLALDLKECPSYPLNGGPPQFAWGSAISALSGPLYCNNAARFYTLDLGSLIPTSGYNPSIPGILGALADRTLDVYEQDDHNVDYMRLRVWRCPCKSVFHVFGLPHEGVGDADVVLNPNGSLLINNIGASGEDGVAVQLGQADGYCMGVSRLCVGQNLNTAAQLAVVGTVSTGIPWSSTLNFSNTPNPVTLSAQFPSPYDVFMDVKVWNAGAQVVSYNCPVDGLAAQVPPSACFKELDWLLYSSANNTYCYRLLLNSPISVQIQQGGPSATGDEIRICPPIITGGMRLSSFELTVRDHASLPVTGGAVQMFGQLHTILGDAVFEPDGETLSIDLLFGNSGDDGVSIDAGQAESFSVNWAPLDPFGDVPDGASFQVGATGSVGGIPGEPLGTLQVKDVGSEYQITADYSPVGSTSHRLEVYDDGMLVQIVTGHTGPVARVPQWPSGCGKGRVIIGGGSTACYFPEWPTSVPIAIVGGPTVMGDQLRVLAENPSAPFDFLQTFSVVATDIPEITFTGESRTECEFAVALVDSFSAYPVGPICGQGGWEEWVGSTDVCGSVTTEQAFDGLDSLKIIGNVGGSAGLGDDTVHRLSASGGQWTFRAMTFVPNGATGVGYLNLLNTYDDPPGAPFSTYRWSVQVQFNADTNSVIADLDGENTPLIRNLWTELRLEIDLDNDLVDYFYNDVQFVSDKSWVDGVTTDGRPFIQALDLYAGEPSMGGTSGMYFDAISLVGNTCARPCKDSANCQDAYLCTVDACNLGLCSNGPIRYGDVNGDGFVNVSDALCELDTFAGNPESPACSGASFEAKDIAPCPTMGDPDNMGDGFVNVSEVLAVLDTFGANPSAPTESCRLACPGSAPATESSGAAETLGALTLPASSSVATEAMITLVPSRRVVRAGDEVAVDVFVDGDLASLRAYQVTVAAVGTRPGSLTSRSVNIDVARDDYVFRGLQCYTAGNAEESSLLSVLPMGGVAVQGRAYLGTFTFGVPSEAAGLFRLFARMENQGSLLRNASSEPISTGANVATIVVLKPRVESKPQSELGLR